MKVRVLSAVLATAASITLATPALARDGCGSGWQRGAKGYCYPIRRDVRVVVAPARPVIGIYYHRHGWWDGRRYWGHRYYYRGGWGYR